ncbi:hypothetical protein E2C01_074988 [Portunus trituberculatus]|uniref:Uncharacterized protein n=1 Tax=Portunus trituberculatus TaxID=210409 RepID=A0A5B7IF01_PORTR|nr:hypothetical protein [Portunus trituberculatus]
MNPSTEGVKCVFFFLFIPCGLFTGIYGLKGILFGVPSISKPNRLETIALSEEAQPTLGPWTGFEPVRLETARIPKHAWFHCTTWFYVQFNSFFAMND